MWQISFALSLLHSVLLSVGFFWQSFQNIYGSFVIITVSIQWIPWLHTAGQVNVLHRIGRAPVSVLHSHAAVPLQAPSSVGDHVRCFKTKRAFDLIDSVRHRGFADVFVALFLFVSVDSSNNCSKTCFFKRQSSSLHHLTISNIWFSCFFIWHWRYWRFNVHTNSTITVR